MNPEISNKLPALRNSFFQQLKQKRIDAGLTQAKLAAIIGWDRREVNSLENGKRNATIDSVHAYELGCKNNFK